VVTGSVGAILGSHPAKGRKESGGVWAVTCPGRRRFQAVAGTYGQRSGLIHTEEVTGSIPVSPTRSEASCDLRTGPLSVLRQQQTAAAASRHALPRAVVAPREVTSSALRCRSPFSTEEFAYAADSLGSGIEAMPADQRGADG
jgi:hypothetical protein